jgi:hypothetical protein
MCFLCMYRPYTCKSVKVTYIAPQRDNTKNLKQIFPEKKLRGLSPNFHTYESVSDLYIPMIDLPILLQENMWTDPGTYKSLTDT